MSISAQKIWKSAVLQPGLLNVKDDEPLAVLALTDNYVGYRNLDGEFIELAPGTLILVDEVRNIGLWGDDHFEIWPMEYKVVLV